MEYGDMGSLPVARMGLLCFLCWGPTVAEMNMYDYLPISATDKDAVTGGTYSVRDQTLLAVDQLPVG